MDDDTTPRIRYAPGVDPREPAYDSTVVTANWLPIGMALVMTDEWVDEANRLGFGLRPHEQ